MEQTTAEENHCFPLPCGYDACGGYCVLQNHGVYACDGGGENGYGSLFAEIGGWGNDRYKPEIQLLYKRGDGFRQNNGLIRSMEL